MKRWPKTLGARTAGARGLASCGWIAVAFVACISAATSRGEVDGGAADAASGDGSAAMCGAAVVSFSRDVRPLIGSCGGELCHGGLASGSWPYSTLVNVTAYECSDARLIVKPGAPQASYLIQKLAGVNLCSGVRMPMIGAPLGAADMATLESWICQGALDN